MVSAAQAEIAALAGVGLQFEAKTQVIWAPGFFHRQDAQHGALAFVQDRVVDAFVTAVAIDAQ